MFCFREDEERLDSESRRRESWERRDSRYEKRVSACGYGYREMMRFRC